MFVRKKSIIYKFFTSNEFSIHNIAFSSEKKKVSSELGETCAQIKHCLQVKTVQNSSKHYDLRRHHGIYFSLEEVLLWIITSFKVKML